MTKCALESVTLTSPEPVLSSMRSPLNALSAQSPLPVLHLKKPFPEEALTSPEPVSAVTSPAKSLSEMSPDPESNLSVPSTPDPSSRPTAFLKVPEAPRGISTTRSAYRPRPRAPLTVTLDPS